MKYWKIALALVAALVSVSTHCVAANQLKLARHGKTSYVIAVDKDAIPAERTAAKELASYLKKVTGANFAVKSAADVSAKTPCIMVGQTAAVRKLLPEVKWASLGHDGIIIKAKGKTSSLLVDALAGHFTRCTHSWRAPSAAVGGLPPRSISPRSLLSQ